MKSRFIQIIVVIFLTLIAITVVYVQLGKDDTFLSLITTAAKHTPSGAHGSGQEVSEGKSNIQATEPVKSTEDNVHSSTEDDVLSSIWSNNYNTEQLLCASEISQRYGYLKESSTPSSDNKIKYFFALNLYQCEKLLPSLLGAIVEAIRYLGPKNCALSIVEGRSTDATFNILKALLAEMKALGADYHLTTSEIDPKNGEMDRIEALALLRNMALAPLTLDTASQNATVIFINDVFICVQDILELIHQRALQGADMTCAMDWNVAGTIFYDVWVARGINGDSFFEIPQDGRWEFSGNLFWNDHSTRRRYDKKQPFQVYACWNGAVAFTALPFLKGEVQFRRSKEGECYMGEPTLLCKDFWTNGYGRIAVVPTVNVAYEEPEALPTKKNHGYAHDIEKAEQEQDPSELLINWRKQPPAVVKCARSWSDPSWVESVPPLE